MITNVWVEPFTLMMGVHMMDVMIEVMSTSGLAYAPFFIALITSIVEAISQGEDEGNSGELAIKFLREKLIVMIPVFVLAFVPAKNINVSYQSSIVSFTCDAESMSSTSSVSTGSSGVVGNFNGSKNLIPLFWAWVHEYAGQMTNVAIAAMPCASDINLAKTVLDATNLTNPADQQLVGDWSSQCLGPAMNKYVSSNSAVDKKLWVGSSELRSIYSQGSMSMKVKTDLAGTAGLEYDQASVEGAEATVNCDTVYAHIQSSAVSSAQESGTAYKGFSSTATSNEEKTRIAVERVAKIRLPGQAKSGEDAIRELQEKKAEGQDSTVSWTDLTGALKKMVGLIGVAIGNIFKGPESVVVRNSVPISVCIYQMLFLAVVPILLVFSGFSIKATLSLAALYFGLEYTNTIIAMATWVDNVLTSIFFMTGTGGLAASMSDSGAKEDISVFQAAVLQNIQYTSYSILPNIWMGLLAYVGAKGGASMMGAASTPIDQNSTKELLTKTYQKTVKLASSLGFEAGTKAGKAISSGGGSGT